MAGCDYYSCDICGAKTFYDYNCNYDTTRGGCYLEGVGDVKCICEECAKMHTIEIVAKK